MYYLFDQKIKFIFYKIFAIFLLFTAIFSVNSHAKQLNQSLVPTKSLLNGSANYQEVLDWSKQMIKINAENTNSANELQAYLKDFPITLNEECGNIKLLFIKNTPTCGSINCNYWMFLQVSSPEKKITYRYIDNINFSAIRLFCYPKGGDYTYYLLTSLHESNDKGSLKLLQMINNKYEQKAVLEIDYTDKKINDVIDSFWEKMPSENNLLNLFTGQH